MLKLPLGLFGPWMRSKLCESDTTNSVGASLRGHPTCVAILISPEEPNANSSTCLNSACTRESVSMRKLLRLSALLTALLFVSGFAECYKPVTKNQLPSRIKTVAVPAFQMESQALRYKVESRFTDSVMRELVHRGRGLRVQGQREGADAVIEGVIRSFNFGGVLLDDKGRARIFEVTIVAAVTVRDQTENRVLYDNQNFVFRGEYEFASDPRSFFNEEDPAILRMSRSFAESIVSTLINAVEVEKK